MRSHAGQALGAALVALTVVVSGWTDVDRYFNKQMHDASVFSEYSASATFAGRQAAQLPPGTRVLVDERLMNEPTLQFLAPDLKSREGYEAHLLPLTIATDTALLLGTEESPDADYVQRLYPRAGITKFSPPSGGPVLLSEVRVSAEDVASIQGVNVEYQVKDGAARVSANLASLDLDPSAAGVPAPYTADLTAALEAPIFGEYGFQIQGTGAAELLIDGESVVVGDSAVQLALARGTHHVELRVSVDDATGPVGVLWRPPSAFDLVPIPKEDLFSAPHVENGLLGSYFGNSTWSGPPAFQQVDPFVSVYFQVQPLPLPFTVEWNGQLAAPLAGTYRLNATSIDSSQIFVDGAPVRNEALVPLSAGLHDVRLRYEAHSGHNHVELRWQPPGRDWEVIPSAFLFPSKNIGAAQPLPQLPPLTSSGELAPQPAKTLALAWQADLGEGSLPVGVALAGDGGAFVADAGRRVVVKLDPAGRVIWTAGGPSGAQGFDHLGGIAAMPDGGALVVDGESGVISKISAAGQYAGVFSPGLVVYHPRGLTVAANGDVYLADTGDSQVQHLDANGQVVGRIGVRGKDRGDLDQPTGVAVSAAGDVFLVDPAARKVVRFGPSGAVVAEWPYVSGPTVDGPQLSLSRDTLWASDTDSGRLLTFSPNGEPQGSYAPPTGLSQPSGIAVGDGYVVVAEPGSRLVERFDLPATG